MAPSATTIYIFKQVIRTIVLKIQFYCIHVHYKNMFKLTSEEATLTLTLSCNICWCKLTLAFLLKQLVANISPMINVKHLNFNILGVFRKMNFIWSMKILWIFFFFFFWGGGGVTNWGHLYAF